MFTTILIRGHKPTRTYVDDTAARAEQRANSLASLHGVRHTYDAATQTYTVDASSWYDD